MSRRMARRGRAGWGRARGGRARWNVLLVIAAGGALGSLARWAVTAALPDRSDGFAWGTLVENVSGAFLLGVLMVFVLDVWPSTRYVRPFLGVGLLGGYTTFSAYLLDTRERLAAGHVPLALGYLFGTAAVGLLAVVAGVVLARATVAGLAHGRGRRGGGTK
jgi:fluoride exporter